MHNSSYIIITRVDKFTASTPSATRFTSISIQDPLDKEGTSRHNYIQEKWCYVGRLVTSNWLVLYIVLLYYPLLYYVEVRVDLRMYECAPSIQGQMFVHGVLEPPFAKFWIRHCVC